MTTRMTIAEMSEALRKEGASYLDMFFKEKRIPRKVFDVTDSQGVTHSIPNDVVIEAIKGTRGRERKVIEDTLRKIDFANGDVNHYLAHLAKGLAENYAGALRFADDRYAKFPKGISMTVDEVATVVGPEFAEMNRNPPESVTKVREEMQGKTAARVRKYEAYLEVPVGDTSAAARRLKGSHRGEWGMIFVDKTIPDNDGVTLVGHIEPDEGAKKADLEDDLFNTLREVVGRMSRTQVDDLEIRRLRASNKAACGCDAPEEFDAEEGEVEFLSRFEHGKHKDEFTGKEAGSKVAYFTVVLPPGVTKWQDPRKTLTRGAFDTKREAHAWAKKNIPNESYTVREIKDVLPIKAAHQSVSAREFVRERTTWKVDKEAAAGWRAVFRKLDGLFPRWNSNTAADWNKVYNVFRGHVRDAGSAAHYYSEYRAGRMPMDQAIKGLQKEGVKAPTLRTAAGRWRGRQATEKITGAKSPQVGDRATWAGKKVLITDTHGYPVKKVDVRWTESGTAGSPDEKSGHKRNVPVSQIKMAASGLYGYTKGTQRDVEASIRKAQRRALAIAKDAYGADDRVVGFLQTHAKRTKSASARLLLAAMKDIGPKVASGKIAARQVGPDEAEKARKNIHRLLRGVGGTATQKFLKALKTLPDPKEPRWKIEILKGDAEDELGGFESPVSRKVHKEWITILDYLATEALRSRGGIEIPVNWPKSSVSAVGKDKGTYYAIVHGVKTTYRDKARFIYAMKNEAQLPSRMVEELVKKLDGGRRASEKEGGMGLYGFPSKTAMLGLHACTELRAYVGQVACNLHTRRQARYDRITGFLKEHAKQARCGYARMLLSSYPNAPTQKAASESDAWIVWDE